LKTAIIDYGIDLQTLSLYGNKTEHLTVCGGAVIAAGPPRELTHGGLCAGVFAAQAGTLPDVSICLNRDDSRRSNKNDLVAALRWCSDNERSAEFIDRLYNCVINDGYTCAALTAKGENRPSDFRFSLGASPLTPTETLDFVAKLCRPSVILHNVQGLENSADISARAYANITPDHFWDKIRGRFE